MFRSRYSCYQYFVPDILLIYRQHSTGRISHSNGVSRILHSTSNNSLSSSPLTGCDRIYSASSSIPCLLELDQSTKPEQGLSRLVRQATVHFGAEMLIPGRRNSQFSTTSADRSGHHGSIALSDKESPVETLPPIASASPLAPVATIPERRDSGELGQPQQVGQGDHVLIQVEEMVRAMMADFHEAGYLQGHPSWTSSPCVSCCRFSLAS